MAKSWHTIQSLVVKERTMRVSKPQKLLELTIVNYLIGAAEVLQTLDNKDAGTAALAMYITDLGDLIIMGDKADFTKARRVATMMLGSSSVPSQRFAQGFLDYLNKVEQDLGL